MVSESEPTPGLNGEAGDRAIELFDQFVRQYVDPSLHAHFADNDNNAAERVRQAIREAATTWA